MEEYGVLELPAPVRATDEACHGRCALCDSLIHEVRGWSDDRREVTRGPGPGGKPPDPGGRASVAPPAPVLADLEVARLQRVLTDLRFLLERGYWEAALGAARAALTATRRPSVESAAHEHREQERVVLRRR
jgi:hypothetical protein